MKMSRVILLLAIVFISQISCAPTKHYSPPAPQSREGDSNSIAVDLVFRNTRPVRFTIDGASVCSDNSEYCFPKADDYHAAYNFTLPTYVSPGQHTFEFEVKYAPEKFLLSVISRQAEGSFKDLLFEPGYKYTCTLSATEYRVEFEGCDKMRVGQSGGDRKSNQGRTTQERLQELKGLYDAGLITKDVYEKRQQQLIEE